MDIQKRTWAEVDLGSIEHNFNAMKARLGKGTRFLGVVKADAYGHGAPEVSLRLQECGAEYLGVATVDEAAQLRSAGVTLPILILGWTDPKYADELISLGATQTVFDTASAKALSDAALKAGKRLKVHIKIDTGMGRLGFDGFSAETPDAISYVMSLSGLEPEGIFTHFPVADEPDGGDFTVGQLRSFEEIAGHAEKLSGIKFAIRHCANSGAMVNCKETYLDMVRPGLLLYGESPTDGDGGLGLLPAMQLKTRIAHIKELPKGRSVSYGRRYTTDCTRTVAVIPVGYADGLHRSLSGKAEFLLCGRRVKQIGSICMDMCMLDITGIPASVGDVVTVFGTDGEQSVSAGELARLAGTIPYEILCAVSKRIPRMYI